MGVQFGIIRILCSHHNMHAVTNQESNQLIMSYNSLQSKDNAIHLNPSLYARIQTRHRPASNHRPQVHSIQLDERIGTLGTKDQTSQIPRQQTRTTRPD
jgi:hypothetical protein